ncbi:hypothetical protein GCM10011374_38720 [Kocuria dechangensis]|uniref:Uncharacterized protein n=1 Tax=Kocuria dechangensis TaxID=1176249 RepID=A0A917M284_9MICC|nr:hypothetical protein [Kocuria dechangensis]GGG70436.1 hypothetical protein GCM10011374_38720 [Kocuria dechangensis]
MSSTVTHTSWCEPTHCIEDAPDSVLHTTAPRTFHENGYGITVALNKGSGEARTAADLSITSEHLDAAGIRALIRNLELLEGKLQALDAA